ncbi:DUF4845 domain-containing protein [Chitiniphilus purpureus]|uniref:DUF4845 domain-containing protein n=1 Tax=Chitiniphilus purpureus TaxID=2981137 RepID=A0ABY6DHH4_9NEIS|nr:DUF4845 domain-containing protein [Chitiniphilus sp. CD1]UXY13771.1 DUF4845 domain-containing protein [Chitiniphilus sp. CD1]
MRRQQGLSFFGFVIIAILVALAAITFFKVVPTYVEYFSVKKTLKTLVKEHGSAPAATIREGFGRHAVISTIEAVKADDLIITQSDGKTTISVSYEKVVPLVANISLLFDFEASESSSPIQ